MTRLWFVFAVAVSTAFLAPSISAASSVRISPLDTPSPPDAEVPCGIVLVGTSSGVPDPRGEFTIIIRNLAHEPVEGAHVVIDFSNCTPDIRISAVQPWPGIIVDCSPPVGLIEAVTDATGRVDLRIVGGANNLGSGSPAAGFKCATVYADGVNLGQVNVAALDQNGANGVNPADLSVWLPDSFDADFEGRSDFNCTFTINPSDLAQLLGTSLGSGSLQSSASYCH